MVLRYFPLPLPEWASKQATEPRYSKRTLPTAILLHPSPRGLERPRWMRFQSNLNSLKKKRRGSLPTAAQRRPRYFDSYVCVSSHGRSIYWRPSDFAEVLALCSLLYHFANQLLCNHNLLGSRYAAFLPSKDANLLDCAISHIGLGIGTMVERVFRSHPLATWKFNTSNPTTACQAPTKAYALLHFRFGSLSRMPVRARFSCATLAAARVYFEHRHWESSSGFLIIHPSHHRATGV